MSATPVLGSRSCAFGPLTIAFDDRVLEPRPWTLLQSRWAAELSAGVTPGPILELCAGAGQIGLAAAALSDRDLVQVEADDVAAGFARENAAGAGRADRVDVRHAPMESALQPSERFSIVLADPPYLPSAEVTRWPDDPVRAIDGGEDGMTLIRISLTVAARHMTDDAVLLLQVAGERQAQRVASLVDAAPELRLRCAESRRHDAERAVVLLTRTMQKSGAWRDCSERATRIELA